MFRRKQRKRWGTNARNQKPKRHTPAHTRMTLVHLNDTHTEISTDRSSTGPEYFNFLNDELSPTNYSVKSADAALFATDLGTKSTLFLDLESELDDGYHDSGTHADVLLALHVPAEHSTEHSAFRSQHWGHKRYKVEYPSLDVVTNCRDASQEYIERLSQRLARTNYAMKGADAIFAARLVAERSIIGAETEDHVRSHRARDRNATARSDVIAALQVPTGPSGERCDSALLDTISVGSTYIPTSSVRHSTESPPSHYTGASTARQQAHRRPHVAPEQPELLLHSATDQRAAGAETSTVTITNAVANSTVSASTDAAYTADLSASGASYLHSTRASSSTG